MPTLKILSTLLVFSLVMTGCMRRIGSDHYAADSVGQASQSYPGYVVNARKVTVGNKDGVNSGAAIGALAGGIGGAQIGGGHKANAVGGVVGALAGGVLGNFINDELNTQEGIEYTVRLDNGQIMTTVQGPEPALRVGERVLFVYSPNGRSRVQAYADSVPAYSAQPAQYAQAQPVPVAAPVAPQPVQQPVVYHAPPQHAHAPRPVGNAPIPFDNVQTVRFQRH